MARCLARRLRRPRRVLPAVLIARRRSRNMQGRARKREALARARASWSTSSVSRVLFRIEVAPDAVAIIPL